MENDQPPRVFDKNEPVTRVIEDHSRAQNCTLELWTGNDSLGPIQLKYGWLFTPHMGYSHNIQCADISRLVVVHAEVGTYADLEAYLGFILIWG